MHQNLQECVRQDEKEWTGNDRLGQQFGTTFKFRMRSEDRVNKTKVR